MEKAKENVIEDTTWQVPLDMIEPAERINQRTITVGVQMLSEFSEMPVYSTDDAACFDLRACLKSKVNKGTADCIRKIKIFRRDNTLVDSAININPQEPFSYVVGAGERALIPTGLIFDIPGNCSIRLHPRSGNALKYGITLGNAEGVIDSDYTLETYVMVHNTSDAHWYVKHGDRICQGEIVENTMALFREVDYVTTESNRKGGFGSTGT